MYYIYFINEIKIKLLFQKTIKMFKMFIHQQQFITYFMKISADSCVGIGCKGKRAFQR